MKTRTLLLLLLFSAYAATAQQVSSGSKLQPFPFTDVHEEVVMDYGKRTIRITPDTTLSFGTKNKKNCFIVISKKDYYLYVYEAAGRDTTLVARYDCCFGLSKGDKTRKGDMRTPNGTSYIFKMPSASNWRHDFGDGRGSILAYGSWFLGLKKNGQAYRGIGIHGSTNNAKSVPGRASEGCIRLRDADIADLHAKYAFIDMKVVIKSEKTDDLPFEIRAMRRQGITRRRHLDKSTTLTNEQITKAPYRTDRIRGSRK